jgi:hypothetical protein
MISLVCIRVVCVLSLVCTHSRARAHARTHARTTTHTTQAAGAGAGAADASGGASGIVGRAREPGAWICIRDESVPGYIYRGRVGTWIYIGEESVPGYI